MRIAIYISSVTGKTRRMAEACARALQDAGHTVAVMDTNRMDAPAEAEIHIIAFWCRRSGPDDASLTLIENCAGKRMLAIGTIGGNADGDYGRRVENAARNAIEKNNICIGCKVCQGSPDMRRIEKRRFLPKDDPHYVDDAKYRHSLELQGRPNAQDIEEICGYAVNIISRENVQGS